MRKVELWQIDLTPDAGSTLDNTTANFLDKLPIADASDGDSSKVIDLESILKMAVDYKDQKSRTVTAITSVAGVLTIDLSLGDYFTTTLHENITSILFTNLPGAGKGRTVTIEITQHASAAKTVTFPGSFKWAAGVPGVISATVSSVGALSLTTFNNGTAWVSSLVNDLA